MVLRERAPLIHTLCQPRKGRSLSALSQPRRRSHAPLACGTLQCEASHPLAGRPGLSSFKRVAMNAPMGRGISWRAAFAACDRIPQTDGASFAHGRRHRRRATEDRESHLRTPSGQACCGRNARQVMLLPSRHPPTSGFTRHRRVPETIHTARRPKRPTTASGEQPCRAPCAL